MTYVIVGASSGLGRELALKFAEEQKNLMLISRDERDLTALKSDLEIKFKVKVDYLALDFSIMKEIDEKFLSNNMQLKNIEGIMFPVGLMFENDNYRLNQETTKKIINANFLSISYTIKQISPFLIKNKSSIIGFGSVSGLAGRNFNSNYAAAKRGLESFFESLAFEKEFKDTRIQFYILGYLDTNLAFGKNLLLPKASTKKLAKFVYKNRNSFFKKSYYPKYWALVGFFLKLLPFTIIIKIYKFLNK